MAIALYLKIAGVDGESMDSDHKSWIDVEAFSWGATQPSTLDRGGGGGGGKATFHDLVATGKIDKGYPTLLDKCYSGDHIDKIECHAVKAGGSSKVTYLKVELETVLVTNVSLTGSSGADTTVAYSFQGAKLKTSYTAQTEKGGAGAAVNKQWDIKASK